jgi:hypothetical protein
MPILTTISTNYYGCDTNPSKYRTKQIENEIHLVKIGEERKFDHRAIDPWDVKSNVQLGIDSGNMSFYVNAGLDFNQIDEFGFVRVVLSYEAYL